MTAGTSKEKTQKMIEKFIIIIIIKARLSGEGDPLGIVQEIEILSY